MKFSWEYDNYIAEGTLLKKPSGAMQKLEGTEVEEYELFIELKMENETRTYWEHSLLLPLEEEDRNDFLEQILEEDLIEGPIRIWEENLKSKKPNWALE